MTKEGKNEAHIPKTRNNNNNNEIPIADAGLDRTVSEGSTIVLNGHGFTKDHNRKLSYSWTVVSDGNYGVNLANDNTANLPFITIFLRMTRRT